MRGEISSGRHARRLPWRMTDYCWVVWDTMRPTKPGQTRTIWLPKLSEPIAPIKGIA